MQSRMLSQTKKVTAFVGSVRKKNTYKAVVQFLEQLKAQGDVEVELVRLVDDKLGVCKGCCLCFNRGEEFCPLKDDRDILMARIAESDGVIFASPNYRWHMSGLMKIFLDRFGFAIHRPRYFGKVFTSIVTQGVGQGNNIVEYFNFLGQSLGFNTVKGTCLTALDPRTQKDQQKIDKALAELSKRFYSMLTKPRHPIPSWFMLMGFRMTRTTIKTRLNGSNPDYRYFAEKGWFESDYYYPTELGPLQQAIGRIFDQFTPTIRTMFA